MIYSYYNISTSITLDTYKGTSNMTIYDTIKNLEKMLLRLLLGVRLLIYSKKRTTGAVTNKGRLLLKVRALIQTLR